MKKSMTIAVTVTESPMADAAVTSRSVPKSRIAPSPIIPRSGAASKPDGSPRPDGVIHTQNNIRGVSVKKAKTETENAVSKNVTNRNCLCTVKRSRRTEFFEFPQE